MCAMSYLSLLILMIIAIIIIAAIFNPGFQERMFGGGESEMKIAGVLSVTGVSFVALIVGLVAVAIYYELNRNQDLEMDRAVDCLQKSSDHHFSLHFVKRDSVDIQIDGVRVARIKQPIAFEVKKSASDKRGYDVTYEKAVLGNLKLDVFSNSLLYTTGNIYFLDSLYNIENSDFWFRIKTIKVVKDSRGNDIARYVFRFGEGASKESIRWSGNDYEYGKTDSGGLPGVMKIIHDEHWDNSYAIALGAGRYGEYEKKSYIEQINAILVKIGIEK